jgi:hypothetical protein
MRRTIAREPLVRLAIPVETVIDQLERRPVRISGGKSWER